MMDRLFGSVTEGMADRSFGGIRSSARMACMPHNGQPGRLGCYSG